MSRLHDYLEAQGGKDIDKTFEKMKKDLIYFSSFMSAADLADEITDMLDWVAIHIQDTQGQDEHIAFRQGIRHGL